MNRINSKRSVTHWRTAFLFLGFLGSIKFVYSAPANLGTPEEKTPSPSSPIKSLEHDINSPGELAWQVWLSADAHSGSNSGLDSASIPKRITPKSVFIAPQLQACAEGYQADNMGRCQKIVIIDKDAHMKFLLERLNKLYGKDSSASTTSEKKQLPVVTGPLQLNIPLLPDVSKDKFNSQVREDEIPQKAIPLENKKEEFIVNYSGDNDTRQTSDEKHEASIFLNSNSTLHKKNDQESSSTAFVVPVADLIDEANDTFSDIVDYKIPLGLQVIDNRTLEQEKRDEVDLRKEDKLTTEVENSTEDDFVLSEDDLTTLSGKDEVSDDEEFHDSTTVTSDSEIENVTETSSRKDITSDGMTNIDSEMETLKNESDASIIQISKKNETYEADVAYEDESEPDLEDQEKYSDTTQVSEEDSGESEDEILKHGETGMAIPIENQALIQSEKKKTHAAPKDDYPMETTTFFEIESDPIITTTTEGGDDLERNISSGVNINKDFVLETTLLNVNTGKVKNSTKPVSANSTASQQNRDDDLKALFEDVKKLITEPEVILPPQDNRGSSVYGRKRDGQLLETNFQSIEKSHNSTTTEVPTASNPLSHLVRFRDPEAHPIEEQASFHSERLLPPDTKKRFPFWSPNLNLKHSGFESYIPISGTNKQDNQDFVRFPNHERPHQGYVRFPSDDVNSIHNPEPKERFSHSREEYPSSDTSTRSSISFNQKQSNWWIPSPMKVDQQQTYMQAQTSSNQSPMLLRFWEKMPLLRDPSFNSRFSTPSLEKETSSRSSRVSPSRRMNFYKETSPPHEVNRDFSQNVQTSIGG